MVGNLASTESVRPVDVKHLLAQETGRIDESFPDAEVSLTLPDSPVYVPGNDLLARLFEAAETGTGLDIVDWVGGDIRVAETSATGTTVEIRLPTTTPADDDRPATEWFEAVET